MLRERVGLRRRIAVSVPAVFPAKTRRCGMFYRHSDSQWERYGYRCGLTMGHTGACVCDTKNYNPRFASEDEFVYFQYTNSTDWGLVEAYVKQPKPANWAGFEDSEYLPLPSVEEDDEPLLEPEYNEDEDDAPF